MSPQAKALLQLIVRHLKAILNALEEFLKSD
jgi:hypothetical protein